MYWTLFLTFVKIGMFTIGGGYAMLPLIEREVVDIGWLSLMFFQLPSLCLEFLRLIFPFLSDIN